jgi:hypothetical protein
MVSRQITQKIFGAVARVESGLVGAGVAVAFPVKIRWRARVGFRGRVSGKTLSA